MIGRTLNGYTVLESIGEGGMGIVYKGLDTRLSRNVALKFLNSANFNDPASRHRFLHEAQAAGKLNHRNICPIYEICQGDDYLFLVMPLLEGRGLNSLVHDGPLRTEEMIRISAEIAEGLREAHRAGIIHRDIKSGNVMIRETGDVVIMDFGLAKIVGSSTITEQGVTLGTPHYMSPEQARGETLDQRTDIWSLGVVMYEMLCGTLPFSGDQHQVILYRILNEDPEYPTALRSGIPMELEGVVLKALRKRPDERYQSCEEMIADVKRIGRASESIRGDKRDPRPDTSWKRRSSAVMFTDIVGFAGIVHEDENRGVRLLQEHSEILRPIVADHRGEVVETKGDASVVTFPSTLDAVSCAVAIQTTLHKRNADKHQNESINVRIGLHDGDVIFWNNQVYGDAVNIASRIQSRTPAGGIGVSEDVFRETKDKIAYPFQRMGGRDEHRLSPSMNVYTIRLPWVVPVPFSGILPLQWTSVAKWIGVIALVAAVGCFGYRLAFPDQTGPARIVILPFQASDPSGDYSYLADGVTRDLSVAFQAFRPGLHTESIFSAFYFSRQSNSPMVVARDLGVRYVLSGTVRPLGNLVEFRVSLYDSSAGQNVLDKSFLGEPDKIPFTMAELARSVCKAIEVDFGAFDAQFWGVAGDVYVNYLHGLSLINKSTATEADLTQAVAYLSQSVQKDSAFLRAQLALADANVSLYWIHHQGEYLTTAWRYAARVSLLDTSNSTPLSILGQVKQLMYETDSAEHYFAKALTMNPYDVRALTLSGAMVMFEKPDEALIKFQRAREVEPLNAMVFANLGIAQSNLRDFNNASETLQQAINLNRDDMASWVFLGYNYEKMGKIDEARRCYLHVFNTNNKEDLVYPLLFRLLLSLNQIGMADTLTREAVFQLPDNLDAQYYRGVVRLKYSDGNGAREAFMHSLDIMNERLGDTASSADLSFYAPDFAYRGIILARLGRSSEAERDIRRAIELDDKNHQVYLNAAKAYALTGDRHRMIEAFKNAKALNKNELDESFVRGEVEFNEIQGLDSLLYYARQ